MTVTLEMSADSAACPSPSESCLEWEMVRFVKIILFRLISQKYGSRGAVLVWVAAEYVFGVMMGVLSDHHRLSSASDWSILSILSSDWLVISGAGPLMITTLMTFLRSLNNEGQERDAEWPDRPRLITRVVVKWYPGIHPPHFKRRKCTDCCVSGCLSFHNFVVTKGLDRLTCCC